MVYQDAIMREAKRRSVQPNRVVSSPISNQNVGQKVVDWGRDVGSRMVPGIWGAGMKGLDALTEGVAMHNENKRWFQENAPNATNVYADIPMNVRKSVMTGRDEAFYKKYMDLAEMAQDADRKQYYLNQADTARRNLQVTKRINYGLGQLNLDKTPFKGYESYDPGFAGFEGETGPRFDIDRFSEAMSEYLPQELESDIVTNLVEGDLKDDLTEKFVADEKMDELADETKEIPFEYNFRELIENIASIPVNPEKAAQHGFEGSATELWMQAQEQAKQSGLDLSDEEVLRMLLRDGWFNPEDIHTMSEADDQSIENQNEYDNILNQQAEELNKLEDINRQIQIEKDKQEELGFRFDI